MVCSSTTCAMLPQYYHRSRLNNCRVMAEASSSHGMKTHKAVPGIDKEKDIILAG